MESKILVVENEKSVRDSLEILLAKYGHKVHSVANGPEAIRLVQQNNYQSVILDLKLPSMDGLEVLKVLKSLSYCPPVIVVTGRATVNAAAEAIKNGATEFLLKPCSAKQLEKALKNALPSFSFPLEDTACEPILGETSEIKKTIELMKKAAAADSNVFIYGPTGTGKNLVAKAIHNFSRRKNRPFIKIDCAALPSELIESELFGHEKGAFTGADGRFLGKFEQGNHGTIFLDEICNLSLPVQAKLLNVIQDREFTRLKGNGRIKINIRLISASNKNLQQAIKEGAFREDLFYRLDVVSLTLPPLSQRREDIPIFCKYFLNKFNSLYNRNVKGIEKNALDCLMNYDWNGNVRELENLVEQLVVISDKDHIGISDLPPKITDRNCNCTDSGQLHVLSLRESKKNSETEIIINTLKKTGGNKKRTAELLDISRVSLYKKLKEYKINL